MIKNSIHDIVNVAVKYNFVSVNKTFTVWKFQGLLQFRKYCNCHREDTAWQIYVLHWCIQLITFECVANACSKMSVHLCHSVKYEKLSSSFLFRSQLAPYNLWSGHIWVLYYNTIHYCFWMVKFIWLVSKNEMVM